MKYRFICIVALGLTAWAGAAETRDKKTNEFVELVYTSEGHVRRPEGFFDGTQDAASAKVMAAIPGHIQKNRTGRYTIRLRDESGDPVAGRVEVRHVRHDFDWGINLQGWANHNNPSLGKCYVAAERVFNTARDGTFFRAMARNTKKPGDPFVYDGVDESPYAVNWAHDRGMKLRWHCLFYHHAEGRMPPWTPDVKSKEDWWPILEDYVNSLAKRNRGWFTEYDVINEMFTCKGSYKRISSTHPRLYDPGDAKRLFKMVRKTLPEAKLVALEWWALGKDADTHGGVSHWTKIHKLYRELVANGTPVDYLGTQAHFGVTDWEQLRMGNLDRHLDLLGDIGKPVVVTEYSDPSPHWKSPHQALPGMDEEELAAWSRNFISLVFSKPYTRGFTRWQLIDTKGGATRDGGLLSKDGRLKPQYHAFNELVNERWSTRENVSASGDGMAGFEGFSGTYEIRVTGYAVAKVRLTGKKDDADIRLARQHTERVHVIPGAINTGGANAFTVSAPAGIYRLKAAVSGEGSVQVVADEKVIARLPVVAGREQLQVDVVHVPEMDGHVLELVSEVGNVDVVELRFERPVMSVHGEAELSPDSPERVTAFGSRSGRRAFEIRNGGNAPLEVGPIKVEPPFAVIECPSGPIAPGASAALVIGYEAGDAAAQAWVRIDCNDAAVSPFFFAVKGGG